MYNNNKILRRYSENKNKNYESLKKLSEETGFKMFLTIANNFQQN